MFTAGPEKNRYEKRDDCSETNPPGKCHYREPARLRISSFVPKILARPLGSPLRIATTMKPMIMAMMLPRLLPRRLGEHSAEKYTQERAVGVAEDPKHDWDDSHFGMHDDEIGVVDATTDHQN